MKNGKTERRVHPRVTALLRIDYQSIEDLAVDYLLDMSEGGIFIRTQIPFEVGENVDFTVSFPGLLTPVPLSGVVRRRSENPDQPGVGVEFVFHNEESKRAVQHLVALFGNKKTDQERKQGIPYRILLADDNDLVLELFTHALKRLGTEKDGLICRPEIVTAKNGYQALSLIKEQHFDLLILDHYMPEMDGLSLLRIIKETSKLQHLPIVMISSEKDQIKIASLKYGADLFVSKPVQAQNLLATLSALLTKQDAKK